MAFENEYVSLQKLRDCGAEEIYLSRNPQFKIDGIPSYRRILGVFDASTEDYLVLLGSGREELSGHFYWLFRISSKRFLVECKRSSSGSFEEKPFSINWEVLKADCIDGESFIDGNKLNRLKEALSTFGYRGASKQIEGSTVSFID